MLANDRAKALLSPAVELSAGAAENESSAYFARHLIFTWLSLGNGLPDLALRSLSSAQHHQTRLGYVPASLRPLLEAIHERIIGAEDLPQAAPVGPTVYVKAIDGGIVAVRRPGAAGWLDPYGGTFTPEQEGKLTAYAEGCSNVQSVAGAELGRVEVLFP